MNLKINEFLAPEYPIEKLILYNVLYFSLKNKPAAVDVFPEFSVDLSEINSLFCATSNVK